MVWLIGIVAALVGLGRALLREKRLLAASRLLSGRWLETLDEARRACAVARPVRLFVSDAIEAPLTGGWLRPAVLLPAIAESWTANRRRLVLQHELVHVVRGDGLRRLAWRLVATLYWFHPLARIAERQAGLAGEQACDEAVVGLGTLPSLYARHLVEIAETLRGSPAVFASALPMVERNQLERRVVMILDASHSSSRGRGVAIASLAILAATVACAAAAAPAAHARAPQPLQEKTTVGAASLDDSSDTGHHEESFQHHFGDGHRLNARIVGHVLFDDRTGAIRELPRGSSVLIETRRLGKGSQRMRITEEQGEPRYEWRLDGDARPVDADARAWLKEAFEVVAAFRAIGSIQGHVGSLQGQIGSIQGQIGALQGRIGAIQGEEGSLQGKIGAIQGEQGSLQGQIGSHQGAIASLQAARGVASDDLKRRIEREIQQHVAAIRKLEAERDGGTLARRLAEAKAELRAFQQGSRGRILEIERQIAGIRIEDEIPLIEQEIEDFHAQERIDEIERRMAPAMERLTELMRKLGS
jgi:predicted  nucleic acid-binding Zn-ribbon protein